MPPPNPELPAVKPFAQFLQEQRRGLLHAELSEQLAAVVAGVIKHGKNGKLTVTFTVKPQGDDAIEVADTYTTKIPTPPAKASIFFADEHGHISRQRINQPELPLQGLAGGAGQNDDAPEANHA